MPPKAFLRAVAGVVCLIPLLLVTGCGSNAMPGGTTTPASPTALAGNWLLVGTLPSGSEVLLGSIAPKESLAVSIDVNGEALTAAASIAEPCSSSSSSGIPGGVWTDVGPVLTATAAPDGTFTLAPSSAQLPVPSLKGVAPASAGSSWAGSYTFNYTSQQAIVPCTVNVAGPFTATPIGDVTGTYAGTGTASFTSLVSGPITVVPTPLSVTAKLQQGAPLNSAAGVGATNSRLGLAGTISVQGISCFSSGKISSTRPSFVSGSQIDTTFTMDDGSTAIMEAAIGDTAADLLLVHLLFVQNGSCAGNYGFGPSLLSLKR